jgi:hypothetical protein
MVLFSSMPNIEPHFDPHIEIHGDDDWGLPHYQDDFDEDDEDDEDDGDYDEDIVDIAVQEKLYRFIQTVTDHRNTNYMYKIATDILDGKNGLTSEEKIKIAIAESDKIFLNEFNTPDKYKSTEEYTLSEEISFSKFENKYKELFIEEPIYSERSIKQIFNSCIILVHYDTELEAMFFGLERNTHKCGGSFSGGYSVTIDKYVKSYDGYKVYTSVSFISSEGIDEKPSVIWTFDDEYNFIKTEIDE